MTDWNYADVWECIVEVQPDKPALTQGTTNLSWSDFERAGNGIAQWLLSLAPARQDKVALYLHNSISYLTTTFGILKCALVPVNTNYRYADNELVYLWDNADAIAVVFHGTFTERVERVRERVPKVRAWLWVDDDTGPCPEWATPYDGVVGSSDVRVRADWSRSGDDLYMLYTGGTTGMPKGVMWRQDDLFARLNHGGFRRYPDDGGIEGVRKFLEESGPGMTLMPACPLMHGTGAFTSMECLSEGGRIVLLKGRSLDAVELLDTVDREKVNGLVIVGDPFSRPMLAALDAEPGHWAMSSVVGIISSGAMWSEEVKSALLRHHPGMLLMDAFSSSEALGMGSSVSSGDGSDGGGTGGGSGGGTVRTGEFVLGPEVRVLTDDGRIIEPGSVSSAGTVGVLAIGGRNPLGYYKDETKSAATFKVVDGVRYAVPGDYAEVRSDGTIHLLGRGSVCINTAGEKVFPEEVEEVLKTYPGVDDAVVVGVPDEKYGESVVGVLECAGGCEIGDGGVDEAKIIAYVKEHLAGYKAPRHVRVVPTIGRAPNGKVDYTRHRNESIEALS